MNNLEQINAHIQGLAERGYRAPEIDAELRRIGLDPNAVAAANKERRALTPQRVARSALQGLSLGFGDEAEAGMRALAPDQTYREALGQVRGEMDQFAQARPGVALGTELAGALATGGLGGARAAGAMAARGAPTMGRNIATGAGVGAIEGAGKSTHNPMANPWGIAADVATGGAFGGALGGVLPPAMRVAGAAVGQPLGALRRAATSSPTSTAARRVNQAALEDRQSLGAMAERMRQYGQGAMPMDVAGDSTRRLAETAMLQGGEAASEVTDRLRARAAGQHGRVLDELYRGTGQPGNLKAEMDAVTARQRAEGKVNYDLARQTTPEFTDDLAELISRPDMSDAWAIAKRSAANQNRQLPEYFELDAEGKIIGVREIPDMEAWDWIKRGLDAKVEAHTDPVTGRVDPIGRDTVVVKNQLLDILDAANPDYAKARGAWSRESRIQEAAGEGRKIFKPDAEVSREYVEGLPDEAMAGYRLGATRAIEDEIKRTGSGDNLARRQKFKAPLFREKMEPAFQSADAYEDFLQQLNVENAFAATKNQLLGGSQTGRRLIGDRNEALSSAGGALADAATNPGGFVGRTFKWLLDNAKANPGIGREEANAILKILAEEDPGRFTELMRTGQINQLFESISDWGQKVAPAVPGAAAGGLGATLFGE